MANAVTPEVANELTFRFASTYLSIISAFSSRGGQWREQHIHPHLWRIEQIETRRHAMDTAKRPDGVDKLTKFIVLIII